jgi:acyl dehydratase
MSAALRLGQELGPSSWLDVDQDMIDAFAACTGDRQWVHVDRERAASGAFGTTIAHGFLTLSLCVPLLYEVGPLGTGSTLLNYGVDRVRFPAPVPSGSRIRARFAVTSIDAQPPGERVVLRATVERDGGDKPVCVADLVLLILPGEGAVA